MNFFRPVLMFFLLVSVHAVRSQPIAEKRLEMQAITIQNGLSQGMINCIYQDHFGFMWFGTMDGLNRYDGYHFTVYRHNILDSNSVSGNFITSLLEDREGRLWVGTALNGLNLFDRDSEQFTRIAMDGKMPLSNNTVLSIQEDKFGAIWVGTANGLNKIVTGTSQNGAKSTSIQVKQISLTNIDGTEAFKIIQDKPEINYFEPSFCIAKNGTIWVSTFDHVFRIKPALSQDEVIKEDIEQYAGNVHRDVMHKIIYKIFEDTANGLLCFKGFDYFTIIHESDGKKEFWDCAPLNTGTGRNQVVTNRGVLWDRTGNGLHVFDLLHKQVSRVVSNKEDISNMLQYAFSVYKDRGGIIWIGTSGYGLLKYNPRTAFFNRVNTQSVTWMQSTPGGNLLTITGEPGYFIRDTSNARYLLREDVDFSRKLNMSGRILTDVIVQDKQGMFWVHSNGLAKLNQQFQKEQMNINVENPLFSFFIDRSGRLLFNTPFSFCIFRTDTKELKEYRFPVSKTVSSPYNFCQVIFQDAKGLFWMGTTQGLFCFNETKKQWLHFYNDPVNKKSLSSNVVFSICDDPGYPGEYLWIGTNGGGLNRLCIQTGLTEHVTTDDGLPNMVVYGILPDEEKNVWISTNNGIARYKPSYALAEAGTPVTLDGGVFTYYNEEDGLQSNEFNRYAYSKSIDGVLFFGGVNGFNYFNPKEISGNTVVPGVVITDFKIKNKSVAFKGKTEQVHNSNATLSKPVFLTQKIVLPFTDNVISFDFAAMDFTAPEKNLYQYRLEGFDKDWIQAGTTHTATYTNLDPGTYFFMVKGSNSNGLWNEKGLAVQLVVLPPWYMTWLFRVAVIVVIGLLLYFFFNYRLQQKVKLLEVRNNIASDLHDEIGSTLSSVYIYSEVAQHAPDENRSDVNTYLKQISADVANMIEALGDIVWTVDAKNDRFENIINRMRATAIELFEASGYELHLNIDEALNNLTMQMEDRKNFYLVYKEAINNTAKYATGKNVWIRLAYEKPYIVLSVKDDGKGFNNLQKMEGNGLASMQRRAMALHGKLDIVSAQGKGTEIKLVFGYS